MDEPTARRPASLIKRQCTAGRAVPWPELERLRRVLRAAPNLLDALRCELGPPALTTTSARIRDDVPVRELEPDTVEQLDLRTGMTVQLRDVEWAHAGVAVGGAHSAVLTSHLDARARRALDDGVPLGAAIAHLGHRRLSLLVSPHVTAPTADPAKVVLALTTRLDIGGAPVALLHEFVRAVVVLGHAALTVVPA